MKQTVPLDLSCKIYIPNRISLNSETIETYFEAKWTNGRETCGVGAIWHHDHKIRAMWVGNATWLNACVPM